MNKERYFLAMFIFSLLLFFMNCNPLHKGGLQHPKRKKKNRFKRASLIRDNRRFYEPNPKIPEPAIPNESSKKPLPEPQPNCLQKTNNNRDFCSLYSWNERDYLHDQQRLNKALKNFISKVSNSSVDFNFIHFDLELKNVEENFEIDFENCGELFKANKDKLFCLNVKNNDRVYKGYEEFNEAVNNFQEKRHLYNNSNIEGLVEKMWDPYFDVSLDINKLSKIEVTMIENILQCSWMVERLMKLYLNQDGDERANNFCTLVILKHRKYTSLKDMIQKLKIFLDPSRPKVLEDYFDYDIETLRKTSIIFKDTKNCTEGIMDWKGGPKFNQYFCNNTLRNQNKSGYKAFEFERIYNQAFSNFKKNDNLTIFSEHFYKSYNEVMEMKNITFSTFNKCQTDLPFLVTLIYDKKFRKDKVNIFCYNYVIFNRTYPNVETLREKLGSFTKNYEKYHNRTLGANGMGYLSVDCNKFFDYSNEDYSELNFGLVNDSSTVVTDCGFETFDNKSIIRLFKQTASSLNAFNGFRFLSKPPSGRLKVNDVGNRGGIFSRILRGFVKPLEKLSENNEEYLNGVTLAMKTLIKRIGKVPHVQQNAATIQSGCPNLGEQPLKIEEQYLLDVLDLVHFGIISDVVDDQGDCGSCWALSLAGMLESRSALRFRSRPQRISRKYLIDCSGLGSCKGGDPASSLHFLLNNGAYAESNYPNYNQKKETCRVREDAQIMELQLDEQKLLVHKKVTPLQLRFLLFGGPVVVHLDAQAPEFVFYSHGILKYKCKTDNHSVLLVGYGKDEKLKKGYWIIKNSWGQEWGMEGYARIYMSEKWDACGMYSRVVELRSDT